MARRARRKTGFWTKRKIRGVIGVGLVVWVAIAFGIPTTTFGSLFGTKEVAIDGTYALHIPGIPPVKYSADINYTVVGDFSVGTDNPIYVDAVVHDANRSDFGSLFGGIGLLNQEVQFVSGGVPVVLKFQPSGQGSWKADGTVAFSKQINFTGPVLSPLPGVISTTSNSTAIASAVTSQVKAYGYPFPKLQPQSYTDALSFNESLVRYALAGSALLLVALLPAFDAVLLGRNDQEGQTGDRARRGPDSAGGTAEFQPCTNQLLNMRRGRRDLMQRISNGSSSQCLSLDNTTVAFLVLV